MIKIADLLDRDFSSPIEETVRVNNNEADTVFSELIEYVATDSIRAACESLFGAAMTALTPLNGFLGVWISGCRGAGKSHFAKTFAGVLANREVRGVSASSLFVKLMASSPVTENVAFLNRQMPCDSFMLDGAAEIPARASAENIIAAMCGAALRDLDCAKDNAVMAHGGGLLARVFDLFEACRPGKTCAFILDGMDDLLGNLRSVLEQFAGESRARLKAGRIPGPVWIVVTARQKPPDGLADFFEQRIDLPAHIGEIAAHRVLRKQQGRESSLRKLFQDHGVSLIQNVHLERSSRRTDFDEDRFVQFYPYLPHLIDLSIDITAGVLRDPNAPALSGGGNYTIVKQCFEMLASDRTRIGEAPVGTLVSIDKIYDLLEGSIPPEKQHDVFIAGARCEDKGSPGMAARVAKAVCLMEFVKTDLPRTAKNIAALLAEQVADPSPTLAVAVALERMKKAHFVSETEAGWTLYGYDFDGLRDAASALEWLNNAVGRVNPRPSGWHNDFIQLVKKWRVGALAWYTRPVRAFNASVSRSIEEIVGVLNHLVDLPTDVGALQKRLAEAEKKSASMQQQIDLLREQVAALGGPRNAADPRFSIITEPGIPGVGNERTAYVVGLFGTGRQYVCELMRQNLGERAKYLRDTIRLHAGPTSMIYSGHATLKYVSRAQHLPAVTSRILAAVKAGFADLIFVYRHPLDSLLTNWVWWRTYLREGRCIAGISQVYRNTDDLCADLERYFAEFQAFAAGDPAFFDAVRGPRFLSFPEFVEETELYLQSAASLTLRLEDFAIDPRKEFSKIVQVIAGDLDFNRLQVDSPRSKPYGYLAVRGKVPLFRSFIDALRAGTTRRIQRLGYEI
jgi:hypothetical protein